MKATSLRSRRWCSRVASLIVNAALLVACTQAPTPGTQPAARPASPGQADDFSWYWDEVSALPSEPGAYSIEVRFTNMSEGASRIPDCWAIPGPGRAGAIDWDERPLVQAGETAWVTGSATFARRIAEIDEVVCDPEVAASYRR